MGGDSVNYRVLKGGVQGEGVRNPKDSVWEDWGTLGNIGGNPSPWTPPLTTL